VLGTVPLPAKVPQHVPVRTIPIQLLDVVQLSAAEHALQLTAAWSTIGWSVIA
jgi:hypothetical protein